MGEVGPDVHDATGQAAAGRDDHVAFADAVVAAVIEGDNAAKFG